MGRTHRRGIPSVKHSSAKTVFCLSCNDIRWYRQLSIPSSPKYILDTPTHATVGEGVRLVFFSGVDNEEQPKKKWYPETVLG